MSVARQRRSAPPAPPPDPALLCPSCGGMLAQPFPDVGPVRGSCLVAKLPAVRNRSRAW